MGQISLIEVKREIYLSLPECTREFVEWVDPSLLGDEGLIMYADTDRDLL